MRRTKLPKLFKIFLIASIGFHVFFLFLLFYNWATNDSIWSGGVSGSAGVVTVTLMSPEGGDRATESIKSKKTKSPVVSVPKKSSATNKKRSNQQGVKKDAVSQLSQAANRQSSGQQDAVNTPGFGKGDSPTPAGGDGSGYDAVKGASQAPDILALIRQKILRAKKYPLMAQRRGTEGLVTLKFKLNKSGRLQSVAVIGSSGSSLLDEEAVATIKRAEPYPFYEGNITLGLKFDLRD